MASLAKRKCPNCEENSVLSDDHNFERHDVCENCGTIVQSTTDLYSPAIFDAGGSGNNFVRYTTKPLTNLQKEWMTFIESALSSFKLDQSSVKRETLELFRSMNFTGRKFCRESVTAGCVYIALKSHGQDISLKELSEKLGHVPLKEISRVINYLKNEKNVEVSRTLSNNNYTNFNDNFADHEESLQNVRNILDKGEFWKSDGSEVDNESMIRRVYDFVDILSTFNLKKNERISRKNFSDINYVISVSIQLYKAEVIETNESIFHRRDKMNWNTILNEVGLSQPFKSALDLTLLNKYTKNILRDLKKCLIKLKLIKSLKEVKKDRELYLYFKDIFRFRSLLKLRSDSDEEKNRKRRKLKINNEDSTSISDNVQVEEEEVNDSEIDCYIRSPKEAEKYRILCQKLICKTQKKKIK